ncbi:MAG: hypothetical protein HYV96_05500 [Opitutae bacterium]|nr:hypothetical protein [Opitutae bacterium]
MSQTYKGAFVVVNQTNSDLSNVSVQFVSKLGVAVSSAATLSRDANDTIFELPPVSLEGSSDNTDNWKLSFITQGADATPVEVFLGNVNCDFTAENEGGVVRVQLYQSSFDIIMPVKGSKQGVKYEGIPG